MPFSRTVNDSQHWTPRKSCMWSKTIAFCLQLCWKMRHQSPILLIWADFLTHHRMPITNHWSKQLFKDVSPATLQVSLIQVGPGTWARRYPQIIENSTILVFFVWWHLWWLGDPPFYEPPTVYGKNLDRRRSPGTPTFRARVLMDGRKPQRLTPPETSCFGSKCWDGGLIMSTNSFKS